MAFVARRGVDISRYDVRLAPVFIGALRVTRSLDWIHDLKKPYGVRAITKQGAGGAAFFLIESGEAIVSVGGKRRATLTKGDYFGEIALIDEGARSATITASTELVCYGLTYWEFRPLVQQNATIAWNLLQTLVKRLRNAEADQEP